MRYFLKIAYQGTHYHGWQKQHGSCTLQGIIELKLTKLMGKPMCIVGSSRTDTGVHAQQQWAHVDFSHPLQLSNLQYKLNLILPPDIAILGIYPVKSTAHARFDALSRTYQYQICQSKNPFIQATSYNYRKKLDVGLMNEAAALLLQHEDFEVFSKLKPNLKHYRCTLFACHWQTKNDQLIFTIQANRFLWGMVRAIVGNLISVGLNRCSLSNFEQLIINKDRQRVAPFAPACGLTLQAVNYPLDIFMLEENMDKL